MVEVDKERSHTDKILNENDDSGLVIVIHFQSLLSSSYYSELNYFSLEGKPKGTFLLNKYFWSAYSVPDISVNNKHSCPTGSLASRSQDI